MTDLERLWKQLGVGPAPVDQILRDARRSAAEESAQDSARQHRWRRPVLRSLATAGAVTALGAAFLVGTSMDGPADRSPGADGPLAGPSPAAFQGELQAPASCDELLDFYVERALDVVGPYGWESPYPYLVDDVVAQPSLMDAERSAKAAPAPVSETSVNSETGTNVQEAGVDEPDLVKTDGELLVRLDGNTLTTYDVSGEAVQELGDIELPDFHDGEILLAGDNVVALGNDGTRDRGQYGQGSTPATTRVVTVDVAGPAAPAVTDTVDYGTSLVTARQHGGAVRLVTATGLPDLDFVRPSGRRGDQTALEANREVVSETTIEDWLPTYSVGEGDAQQLLDCDRVAIPESDLGLDTMGVVGFDAADPTSLDTIGLAADASLAYESDDHLYLASSPTGSLGICRDFCVPRVGADEGTTHVFDFELDGAGSTYVGSGEVEGAVADRWAMDEYDGVLRLAVGPTLETGNFNSVVTLEADGDELVELGRVDKLGVNESIESVRWFDGLAIVVTFRQVDPLYAVDLSDQAAPELTGKLKIPGFSSYLHPLGGMRMVGVGEGPQGSGGRGAWGAQAGLFDVTNLADPRRLDVVGYGGGTTPQAGTDPRQFTWLPRERTVLTVISKGYSGRTGYVSVLSLGDAQMSNRMVQVEYGSDVDDVRLVPVAQAGEGGQDRVVLVTGEDVRFFEL